MRVNGALGMRKLRAERRDRPSRSARRYRGKGAGFLRFGTRADQTTNGAVAGYAVIKDTSALTDLDIFSDCAGSDRIDRAYCPGGGQCHCVLHNLALVDVPTASRRRGKGARTSVFFNCVPAQEATPAWAAASVLGLVRPIHSGTSRVQPALGIVDSRCRAVQPSSHG